MKSSLKFETETRQCVIFPISILAACGLWSVFSAPIIARRLRYTVTSSSRPSHRGATWNKSVKIRYSKTLCRLLTLGLVSIFRDCQKILKTFLGATIFPNNVPSFLSLCKWTTTISIVIRKTVAIKINKIYLWIFKIFAKSYMNNGWITR